MRMFRKFHPLYSFTCSSSVTRHCESVVTLCCVNGEVGVVGVSSFISSLHIHSQTHRANAGQVVEKLISYK